MRSSKPWTDSTNVTGRSGVAGERERERGVVGAADEPVLQRRRRRRAAARGRGQAARRSAAGCAPSAGSVPPALGEAAGARALDDAHGARLGDGDGRARDASAGRQPARRAGHDAAPGVRAAGDEPAAVAHEAPQRGALGAIERRAPRARRAWRPGRAARRRAACAGSARRGRRAAAARRRRPRRAAASRTPSRARRRARAADVVTTSEMTFSDDEEPDDDGRRRARPASARRDSAAHRLPASSGTRGQPSRALRTSPGCCRAAAVGDRLEAVDEARRASATAPRAAARGSSARGAAR